MNDIASVNDIKTFLGKRKLKFNATFNNISVISWRSVLLVDEIGGPGKKH